MKAMLQKLMFACLFLTTSMLLRAADLPVSRDTTALRITAPITTGLDSLINENIKVQSGENFILAFRLNAGFTPVFTFFGRMNQKQKQNKNNL